ncbi:MAG TPA: YfcE family phosphodiesterase [Candidatus Mcinerneyibacterium sp.]|nr:YfcE family phosphodiesterase [Candidatus Mcinerneyibacterium sp.]
MKIGIMSDTHEDYTTIKWAVNFFNKKDIKFLIHLGDIISPIMYNYFKEYCGEYLFIYGNNDGERRYLKTKFDNIFEPPYLFEKFDKRFYLTHIPVNWDKVIEKHHPDFIFFGHTHEIFFEKRDNTVIFNPGESCGLLENEHNISVLDLEKNKIKIFERGAHGEKTSYSF